MPVNRQTDPDGLTIKQRAFVHAYCGEAQGNGTRAAKLAGYAGDVNTLKNIANKLINHELVVKAIRSFADKVDDSAVVSVIEAKRILSEIARDTDQETKDRIAAIDKLLKSGGAYIEKREVEHKGAAVSFVFEDNGRGPRP
jgi:phage terminase small subunit